MAAELRGVENELTRRMAELTQQFRDEIDGDYYCVVVFQTRRQLFAWAAAKGLIKEGEELNDLYIDGEKLAALDGVKLPAGPAWQETKTKSRYAALARPLPRPTS